MLKIRLQRVGKKNSPSYRVVLAEHTAPPQGKFQEILGHYNPRKKEKSFKKERIEHWLSKGARLSPTVYNLLVDEKVFEGPKLKAWRPKKKAEKPKEEPKVKEEAKEPEKEEVKAEAKPKAEEPKEEKKVEKVPKEEKPKEEEPEKEEAKEEEKKNDRLKS